MAVIDGIPGLEAWICVNGKRATEYDPGDDFQEVSPTTTTKYIESVSGASFSLHFKVHRTYKLSSKTYVLGIGWKLDGVESSGWRVMRRNGEFSIDSRNSFDTQGREIRENFQFGDIKTVEILEKKRVAEDKTIAAKLGVIQFEVRRYIETRKRIVEQQRQQLDVTTKSSPYETNETPSTVEPKTPDQTLEIAEKALKGRALSNLVSFGPAQIVQDSSDSESDLDENQEEDQLLQRETPPRELTKWTTEYSPVPEDNDQPFAAFRFLYRSMDDLQMMQIVPPDSSTQLMQTLSETEIRKLAKAHLDQINTAKDIRPKNKRSLKRRHAEVAGADEVSSSSWSHKSGRE